MKKEFFTFIIFTLLSCFLLVSCSEDSRKTEMIPESVPQDTADSDTSVEEIMKPSDELIAPPLSYHYSQEDERYIYYIYYDEIHRWSKETGEEQLVYKSDGILRCMERYQNFLYFIEAFEEDKRYRLCSVSVDRENASTIGWVDADCLGMTEQYLFVRYVYGDGKISDKVYEAENGKAAEVKADSIIYDTLETGNISTNLENTELQKEGVIFFRSEPNESINLKAYSDKYVFADILDEDGRRKKILFYDLARNTSQLFDNQNDIYMELHGDFLIAYLYGEKMEIQIVDLKGGLILNK